MDGAGWEQTSLSVGPPHTAHPRPGRLLPVLGAVDNQLHFEFLVVFPKGSYLACLSFQSHTTPNKGKRGHQTNSPYFRVIRLVGFAPHRLCTILWQKRVPNTVWPSTLFANLPDSVRGKAQLYSVCLPLSMGFPNAVWK